MATVKSALVRKLEKPLAMRVPAPATVRLDDHDGSRVATAEFSRGRKPTEHDLTSAKPRSGDRGVARSALSPLRG